MSYSSISLMRHLIELEQQIADAPQHVASLLRAQPVNSVPDRIHAQLDAEQHMRAVARTTAHIKAQVTAADHLGAEVASLSELVLRATRSIVLTELTALHELVFGPAARDRTLALFRAPFERFGDFESTVANELHRITSLWKPYRGMPNADRTAYRAALREAHTAMHRLGHASEVAAFLRRWCAYTDWPSVRAACAAMVAALTIHIDVDPDLPLLLAPSDAAEPKR